LKRVDVVFLEADDKLFPELKPHYERFFQAAGYEANIIWVPDERRARAAIQGSKASVFVCDLGYGNDFIGLMVIRNIRQDFPEIYVIGTSRGEFTSRDVAVRQPSFHLFLEKQDLFENGPSINGAVKLFRQGFRIEPDVEILNLDQLKTDIFKKSSEIRELEELVRQIVFTGHETDELIKANVVALLPISGGFSGSHVFKMEARNRKSGILSVPAVLKISRREFAEAEISNYQRYVKWGVPYLWRVDILGTGYTKNFGAIAYSFVMSGLQKFEALTQYIREGNEEIIRGALERLFSPEMKRWYGAELIRDEENINERYSQRYFRGTENKNDSTKRFNHIAQREFGARFAQDHILVDGEQFAKPVELLFGRPHGQYKSCICHGDLNSNNLIVAANGELIFIDFQETGRGHVFEDFITMEASIRLYNNFVDDTKNWAEALRREQRIGAGDDPGGDQPAATIGLLRRLARRNFPSEEFRNYMYGVGVFHFRLLRADITDNQAARCVAAILAAIHFLQSTTRKN
jgi:hypothetical protein